MVSLTFSSQAVPRKRRQNTRAFIGGHVDPRVSAFHLHEDPEALGSMVSERVDGCWETTVQSHFACVNLRNRMVKNTELSQRCSYV